MKSRIAKLLLASALLLPTCVVPVMASAPGDGGGPGPDVATAPRDGGGPGPDVMVVVLSVINAL